MKTPFPQNYVYVLRTTKTLHMVSFIDFYFHFPANFTPNLRLICSLQFTCVMSRVTHSEPGLLAYGGSFLPSCPSYTPPLLPSVAVEDWIYCSTPPIQSSTVRRKRWRSTVSILLLLWSLFDTRYSI